MVNKYNDSVLSVMFTRFKLNCNIFSNNVEHRHYSMYGRCIPDINLSSWNYFRNVNWLKSSAKLFRFLSFKSFYRFLNWCLHTSKVRFFVIFLPFLTINVEETPIEAHCPLFSTPPVYVGLCHMCNTSTICIL